MLIHMHVLQGFDITPDLRRMCPSLTLQQIYKLSEHHHDDWITAVGDNQGTKTIVLLETLKRAVDSSGGMATPPRASPMMSADGVPQTPNSPGVGPNPYPSPGSISSTHQFEDEDNLLLDSQVVPPYFAMAVLSWKKLTAVPVSVLPLATRSLFTVHGLSFALKSCMLRHLASLQKQHCYIQWFWWWLCAGCLCAAT